MTFSDVFPEKTLLGMIHMPALPSAPRSSLTLEELVQFAVSEAAKLEAAGLDGAIVENVGDAPFFRGPVPPATVAAMAIVVREVKRTTRLRIGVNMLRNDCCAALEVAHVAGADFIRCNVVVGAYVTDQGIIQGCAAELARLRHSLRADVLLLGDVHVKHAAPLYDVPIEDAASDLAERGGVDAVIVSGARSPDPPSFERFASVKGAVDLPVLIGSGIGLVNAREFYTRADGVILGEVDFKVGGIWGGPSDADAYAEAVKRCRMT
jgi:membrane complex biogenesis BtpA family protein